MLQIKSIWHRADAAAEFDAKVNKAIADGWELVRREIVPGSAYDTTIFHTMFYAELVKETEPEPEQAPVEWEITRDPKLPYRCPHCGYKTDLPMTECPNCEELASSKDWEGAEA